MRSLAAYYRACSVPPPAAPLMDSSRPWPARLRASLNERLVDVPDYVPYEPERLPAVRLPAAPPGAAATKRPSIWLSHGALTTHTATTVTSSVPALSSTTLSSPILSSTLPTAALTAAAITAARRAHPRAVHLRRRLGRGQARRR